MVEEEPAATEPLLTTAELCEFLKIPASTLSRWRQDGRGVPHVRLVGTIRYRLRDVLDYLDNHTIRPRDRIGGR